MISGSGRKPWSRPTGSPAPPRRAPQSLWYQPRRLAAIRPALASLLRSESLHLEWVQGDRVNLVIGHNDPLEAHAPRWLSLAGTRTAEALLEHRALREPP